MAGIYIHIPFCKQACYYCNFHFSTSLQLKKDMVGAIVTEIGIRGKSKEDELAVIDTRTEFIETIYFGGGTPSLLSLKELQIILSALRNQYQVLPGAEITLEANPDDLTPEKLEGWRNAGINRLSVGLQSFLQENLEWMNRAHNSLQAKDCIHLIKQAGFVNFSADFIFGIPGLSDDQWKQNVQSAIDLEIPHLSTYALTVEPGTALQKMIALKKKKDVNADVQAEQYIQLMQMMRVNSYEHYEISNFARPGFRSRHNSSYWEGKKYIGMGPSAHSYNGEQRMWNKANNSLYIASLQQNLIPFECELLTPSQQLNEYIMTSIRTIGGLDLQVVEERFSKEQRKRIEDLFTHQIKSTCISRNSNHIMLTDEGKLLADGISLKLFS